MLKESKPHIVEVPEWRAAGSNEKWQPFTEPYSATGTSAQTDKPLQMTVTPSPDTNTIFLTWGEHTIGKDATVVDVGFTTLTSNPANPNIIVYRTKLKEFRITSL